MAADFWTSTHCKHWLFSSEAELSGFKNGKKSDFLTPNQEEWLMEYLLNLIQEIGETLLLDPKKKVTWRQGVISTAKLLFRRFYLLSKFDDCDPRLIVVTCLFLAAKLEEYGQFKIETIIESFKTIMKSKKHAGEPYFIYTMYYVQDYEFKILAALEFDLVVFHPYRDLVSYAKDAQMNDDILKSSWAVVNDMYKTDVIFLYPPYFLSLAALFVGCVHVDGAATQHISWFNSLNISLDELRHLVTSILSYYASVKDRTGEHKVSVLQQVHDRFLVPLRRLAEDHRDRGGNSDLKRDKRVA